MNKYLISVGDAKTKKEIVIYEDISQQVTQLVFDIENAVEAYYYARHRRPKLVNSLRRVLDFNAGGRRREKKDFDILNQKMDELSNQITMCLSVLLETSDQFPDDADLDYRKWLVSRLLDQIQEEEEEDQEWRNSQSIRLQSGVVIAVSGRGGIGKTTLVESLYSDPWVVSRFPHPRMD